MDPQTAINFTGAIIIAGIGWFCKAVWDAVHALQEDIHNLEVTLPTNYVQKDDFSDAMRQINEKLDKISDKLDGKMDKS